MGQGRSTSRPTATAIVITTTLRGPPVRPEVPQEAELRGHGQASPLDGLLARVRHCSGSSVSATGVVQRAPRTTRWRWPLSNTPARRPAGRRAQGSAAGQAPARPPRPPRREIRAPTRISQPAAPRGRCGSAGAGAPRHALRAPCRMRLAPSAPRRTSRSHRSKSPPARTTAPASRSASLRSARCSAAVRPRSRQNDQEWRRGGTTSTPGLVAATASVRERAGPGGARSAGEGTAARSGRRA